VGADKNEQHLLWLGGLQFTMRPLDSLSIYFCSNCSIFFTNWTYFCL